MIKKHLCYAFIAFGTSLCAQKVGIGTSNPETELHVNGSMKTIGMVIKDPLEKLGATEDYSFLIKSPAPENKITSYNQSFLPQNPAPLNIIQYKITCDPGDKDWVQEYDTKINSDKFLVVISSFAFTQPVIGSDNTVTPVPQIYAYYTSGTWKLKADYEGFSPTNSSPVGIWTLNLLVFDRTYAKEFNFTQSMANSTTGSATTPLIQ
jgi:hypothetical protein